ncbi:MAG: hypothetical protein HWN68_02175 [Desulfobacterales bacterium]|nr:hypothetical protein [Desulfobacterales bacterium]
MRYEIDREHNIVDFYIEDEHGREQHSAMGLDEASELAKELMKNLDASEEAPDCDNCDERMGEPMINEGYL